LIDDGASSDRAPPGAQLKKCGPAASPDSVKDVEQVEVAPTLAGPRVISALVLIVVVIMRLRTSTPIGVGVAVEFVPVPLEFLALALGRLHQLFQFAPVELDAAAGRTHVEGDFVALHLLQEALQFGHMSRAIACLQSIGIGGLIGAFVRARQVR
jgi:hypothetical protein